MWWIKRYSLKVLPHKLFVNYKGENSNFILDKPAHAILSQVTNITITNERINLTSCAFSVHITSVVFLPQIYYNLNLIMKKCQTNWHLIEIVFKITCLHSSKMSHPKKKKIKIISNTQKSSNHFSLKVTKDT